MLKLIIKNRKISLVFAIIFLLFTNVFFITGIADEDKQADLIIYSLIWKSNDYINPDTLIEGEEVNFTIKIQNQGTKNITADENKPIKVGLFIDDEENNPISTNFTNKGLNIGETCYINLSWIPNIGDGNKHVISIEVNYDQTIIESDYNYNAWKITLYFSEKYTDLEIIDLNLVETPRVNKKVNIIADVINNGADTNIPIKAILSTSEEGEIENITKEGGLQRNEVYNFSFNWTPSFLGSQILTVKIVYNNEILDIKEKTVFVNVSRLKWWNINWHYRYFIVLKEEGIFSNVFNFTSLLNKIYVFSQVFENDTITIVEYNTEGKIIKVVENFKFNESDVFDPVNNAIGSLIWDSRGASKEKYYCIYFDVEANSGNRTGLNESDDITKTGDVQIVYTGFVEGWWVEIQQPINGSYCFINETKEISIVTSAHTDIVTVEFSWNNSIIETIELTNVENNIKWIGEYNFSKYEGNWTIKANSSDTAGYFAFVEHDIYVGKPDLKVENISFTTNWPPTSPKIFKNDTVNITACIISYYANIENVKVSLAINNINIKNKSFPVVAKDKNNYVSFSWKPNETGIYIINITVDPDNVTDESDETNNQIIKEITVYGWPDLEIKDIILPTKTITEQDKVKIDVIIFNKGEGDAIDYELGLYIESARENIMTYSNKKSIGFVNVSMNESERISLFWAPAEAGEWMLGVMVIVSDVKKDLNIKNNRRVSINNLIVRGFERNKPVISSVEIEPDYQEQGGMITVLAEITDDTGLDYILITITKPNGESAFGFMSKTSSDEFRYDFDETIEVGIYNFIIEAYDISYYSNNATAVGNFTINEDSTYPVIHFFDADPYVQLKDKRVNITCIATDNIGIEKVTVNIENPEGIFYTENMYLSYNNEYIYTNIYNITGRFKFNIIVKDIAGKTEKTNNKTFWITTDLNDIDNDGMPNSWERKYGLNPEDPTDANKDPDKDGYTNLEEYEMGTNPSKDIFLENAAYRLKENIWYIALSIIFLILITLLSIIGIRRKKL